MLNLFICGPIWVVLMYSKYYDWRMGLPQSSVDRIHLSNPPSLIHHEIPIYLALRNSNHSFPAHFLELETCQEAQEKGSGGVETTGMTLDVVETGRQLRGGWNGLMTETPQMMVNVG